VAMTNQPYCFATLSDLQEDSFVLRVHQIKETQEQIRGTVFWIANPVQSFSGSPAEIPIEQVETKTEDTLQIASCRKTDSPASTHDENPWD
jgi:hypothetical protein